MCVSSQFPMQMLMQRLILSDRTSISSLCRTPTGMSTPGNMTASGTPSYAPRLATLLKSRLARYKNRQVIGPYEKCVGIDMNR